MAAGLAANTAVPTTSRTKPDSVHLKITGRDDKTRTSSVSNKQRSSGFSSLVLNPSSVETGNANGVVH